MGPHRPTARNGAIRPTGAPTPPACFDLRMANPSLSFTVHQERLAICRLPADAAIPDWARGAFVTISRTANELSVVCAQRDVPAAVQQERDKVMFGIDGVVPMTTVGLLAQLCSALAAASVPVFVISTFDTDYLLVGAGRFEAAAGALRSLGHRVQGGCPS